MPEDDEGRHAMLVRLSTLATTFLSAFVAAVFVLQWLPTVPWNAIIWIVLGCLCALPFLIRKRWPTAIALSAASMGIAAGLLAVTRVTGPLPDDHVVSLANKQIITLLGTVADNPDPREKGTNIILAADRMITASGTVLPTQGKVLLRLVKNAPIVAYGDTVVAHGKLQRPWPIQDFRYDLYLARQDIFAIMSGVSMQRVRPTPFSILGNLLAAKNAVDARTASLMPEPEASFMMGLTTGTRRTMPDDLASALNATGLTHIVAISGFNITILLTALSGLLFWLPLRWRFVPSITAVIAFTVFTGASASAVRAAIMGILGLTALQLGRQTNMRLLILWTLFFMLAWQPRQLWVDAGFQLSFLAIMGLTEIQPLLARSPLSRLPGFFGIREGACATLAAECATLPWIMALFGRCSLIAPLANLLVTPLIPFAMLMSGGALAASLLPDTISAIVTTATWWCLHLILVIIQTLAHVPFASIATPPLSALIIASIYGALACAVAVAQRKILTNDTGRASSPVLPRALAPPPQAPDRASEKSATRSACRAVAPAKIS